MLSSMMRVNAARVQGLLHFGQGAGFDFDGQLPAGLLQVGVGSGNGLGNAAGVIDVVILENNHVEQAVAVVHAAADEHGPLLAQAEVGRGFAGVQQLGPGAGQQGVRWAV